MMPLIIPTAAIAILRQNLDVRAWLQRLKRIPRRLLDMGLFMLLLSSQGLLLGLVLRPSCISLATASFSSPDAQLQQIGAVMLRNGQLPERSFTKLLQPLAPRVRALMWGFEGYQSQKEAMLAAHTPHTSLLRMLPADANVLEGWWDMPVQSTNAETDAGQCGMARLMLLNALSSAGGQQGIQ
jgi:hypothetical protein